MHIVSFQRHRRASKVPSQNRVQTKNDKLRVQIPAITKNRTMMLMACLAACARDETRLHLALQPSIIIEQHPLKNEGRS